MKRLIGLTIVFLMGLLISLTACSSSSNIGGTVEGNSYTVEGWVDDDTYRLSAAGVPKSSLTNSVARRESAQRAAILNAQYKVLEKFKGSTIEGAAGMSDFETTGIAIAQEINGVIKGGSVKKVTYDDEDNCEIIYEVKSKGLKKKVSNAQWK